MSVSSSVMLFFKYLWSTTQVKNNLFVIGYSDTSVTKVRFVRDFSGHSKCLVKGPIHNTEKHTFFLILFVKIPKLTLHKNQWRKLKKNVTKNPYFCLILYIFIIYICIYTCKQWCIFNVPVHLVKGMKLHIPVFTVPMY